MEKTKLFASINNYEIVNERFAKVKVRIAYEGKNRNGSYISKEAFEKSAYSLKYTPIVGYYVAEDGEFDGHTERLTIQGDDVSFETLTRPYGVVSDEAPFWEDVIEESGNIKSYFTCYGYLWIGRFPELSSIRDRDYSQSMEIIVNNGYWNEEDGLFHVEDMTFDALCILEKQTPCFESSTISLAFSKKEYESEYKAMVNELKMFTLKTLGEEEIKISKENIIEDFNATEVEKVKDIEETQEEFKADVCPDCGEEICECEKDEEDEFAKKKKSGSCGKKKRRCSKDEDEEKEDFEVKYNETLAELNELKAKYVDLESNFESLNNEVSELREFKVAIEKQEKDTKLGEIFNEYSALNKFEEYKTLFEKRYDLEEDEIIKSLKVIAFDNGVNIKRQKKDFSKENNKIKIPLVDSIDIKTNSDWDILERHIKNKLN